MNENLKGLFYSILIVFTGYVITILSIYLDYFGNEVVGTFSFYWVVGLFIQA